MRTVISEVNGDVEVFLLGRPRFCLEVRRCIRDVILGSLLCKKTSNEYSLKRGRQRI